MGHTGSVNGISFNPNSTNLNDLLVVTASGDQTAHIWKANLVLPLTSVASFKSAAPVTAHHSSEDELEPLSEREETTVESKPTMLLLRCRRLILYLLCFCSVSAENEHCAHIRVPLIKLTGHTSVVICADWLMGGNQVSTFVCTFKL